MAKETRFGANMAVHLVCAIRTIFFRGMDLSTWTRYMQDLLSRLDFLPTGYFRLYREKYIVLKTFFKDID